MATTLVSSALQVNLIASSTSPAGAGVASFASNVVVRNARVNGTSAPAGNVNASYKGTVSAGSPVSIDLTSAFVGPDGAVAFTKILDMVIQNQSVTSGNDLVIGDSTGAISNEWTAPFGAATGTVLAQAGAAAGQPTGVVVLSGPLGFAVDSTHKILTITASAGTNVPFTIEVVGIN